MTQNVCSIKLLFRGYDFVLKIDFFTLILQILWQCVGTYLLSNVFCKPHCNDQFQSETLPEPEMDRQSSQARRQK